MTKKYIVEKNDFDAHVGNKSNPHGVTKAQVGLSNVDNTTDSAKNVASANKLTTARTINGVTFDGTKNISIDAVTAAQLQEVKNSVSDGKTKVANAITGKGISTATNATFDTMANNINTITTLAQGTNDANATAAQILSGQTAYVKGNKITGTIPSKGAAYYTPGAYDQTIGAGQYLSGNQTIAGSGNLVTGNIKQGVNIFGVVGSMASLDEMKIGKTTMSKPYYNAYINSAAVNNGTLTLKDMEPTLAKPGIGGDGFYDKLIGFPTATFIIVWETQWVWDLRKDVVYSFITSNGITRVVIVNTPNHIYKASDALTITYHASDGYLTAVSSDINRNLGLLLSGMDVVWFYS